MTTTSTGISTSIDAYTILEHVSDAVIVLDKEWRHLYLNAATEELCGRKRGELLGKDFRECCPQQRDMVAKHFRQAMAQQQPVVFEEAFPAGQKTLEVRVYPRPDTLTVFFRDITGHRAAEEGLRQCENQYQTLVENAPDIIERFDAKLQLIYANPALGRYTGLPVSHFVGKTKAEAGIPGPLCALWEAALRQVFATGEERSFEFSYDSPFGEVHMCARLVPEFGPNGKAEHVLSIIRDISAQKHAEQALQQAKDAAEQANRTKDQFLATLSHELRNPLTPVLTTAEMLEQDPTLSPEQHTAIKLIHRNVAIETRLIEDLLDLNRVAHGKISLHRRPLDVHELMHQAIRTCRSDINAKDIHVSTKSQAPLSHVDADPARLQQILWNLLRNAIKFTPAGGTITVTTDNPAPDAVAIQVQDTGVGIAPAMLPHIFNAFQQGGSDINRQFGGLGLGLAISKTLAELHGGTLTAHSAGPGQGATFTLQLPVLTSRHTLTSTLDSGTNGPGTIAPRGRSGNILLVEDHLDTAQVMAHLLTTFGYRVHTAPTIAAALEAVAETPFDILISDIGLPDGSGLELMARISHTRPIPAIALSGYGMEEDIRRSKDAGFQVHLTKPVDLRALDEALRNLTV